MMLNTKTNSRESVVRSGVRINKSRRDKEFDQICYPPPIPALVWLNKTVPLTGK